MGQGGIGAAGGYIPETVAAVARNLRPQRRKALRGLPLRHATAGRLPFEPVEELLHSHSVLEAGLPQRGDLHVVLHGLPQLHRRLAELQSVLAVYVRYAAADAPVERGRVQEYALPFRVAGRKQLLPLAVAAYLHVVGGYVLEAVHSVAVLLQAGYILSHKPVHRVLADGQEGYHVRIVFDVGGAHVQQPGNLVQGAQEYAVAAVPQQIFAQAAQLVGTRYADLLLAKGGYRRARDIGASLPQQGRQVRHIHHAARQVPDGFVALAEPVHGNHRPVRELPGQPLGYAHGSRHLHLVQHHPAALQLFQGLDEIARIGPQPGMIGRHHNIAGLACKAAQPFDLFPPCSRVFAAMRVGARYDDRVPIALGHQPSQCRNPCGMKFRHISQ